MESDGLSDGPPGNLRYEQEQGRPLTGEEQSGQVWMPVKHAARVAGVPERSAFRWAKKRVVPVRRSGKVQLVEVAALAAYAARPVNARGAGGGATMAAGVSLAVFAQGSHGIPGADPANAATLAAAEVAEERLCLRRSSWTRWRLGSRRWSGWRGWGPDLGWVPGTCNGWARGPRPAARKDLGTRPRGLSRRGLPALDLVDARPTSSVPAADGNVAP